MKTFEEWVAEQTNTCAFARDYELVDVLRVGNLTFYPDRVTNEENDVFEFFRDMSDFEKQLEIRKTQLEVRKAEIVALESYINWRKEPNE